MKMIKGDIMNKELILKQLKESLAKKTVAELEANLKMNNLRYSYDAGARGKTNIIYKIESETKVELENVYTVACYASIGRLFTTFKNEQAQTNKQTVMNTFENFSVPLMNERLINKKSLFMDTLSQECSWKWWDEEAKEKDDLRRGMNCRREHALAV